MSYSQLSGFTEPHLLSGKPKDTAILVGFSGGADSTALLHLLKDYASTNGARLCAAHVNHCIRGNEADRDEQFCRSTCEKLGIEFFSVRINVPKLAKESGKSIETVAREMRYSYFDTLMKGENIPLLATAHNANDNLETLIFNTVRGSSLNGLCGIPQTRGCDGGTVIRPILGMTKECILDYCRDKGLPFVTDSTNTDTDYTRNKIRAEIVPRLLEINGGAIENAARLSASLRADAAYLDSMRDTLLEAAEGNSIELERLASSHEAISSRAIISLYKNVSGGKALEYTHVEAILRLCEKATPHSRISLPGHVEAVIENGRLIFKAASEKKETEPYCTELLEGSNYISQTNCEIIIGYSQNTKNIYKNSILMSLDSATICGKLFARNRQAGDRILSGGMHKSLKKLMCDKRTSVELRSLLPVICDDKGIVAVPYVAIRDGARAKEGSESVIQLRFFVNDN